MTPRHTLITAAAILLTAATAHATTGGITPLERFRDNLARGGAYAPGELLVWFKDVAAARASDVADALGCDLGQRLGERPIFRVTCPSDTEGHLRAWSAHPSVRWVEASWYEQLEAEPDDLSPEQWHHHNTGQRIDGVDGVPGADIGSLAAWDRTTGSTQHVVAIIDTGLYHQHPELSEHIWRNADEICDNAIDDDDNGYVDDCAGWDIGDRDPDPSPRGLPLEKASGATCRRHHATVMAGLAGARGDNGQGVVGVAWRAGLMNLKKHDDEACSSTSSDSIEAIAYALDNGAHVLVLSFNSSSYSDTFQALLAEADARGVITVMSAGNGAEDVDRVSRYPNDYDVTLGLVVANTTPEDVLSAKSNWGSERVHIAAPGSDLRSTDIGLPDLYSVHSGTSYAAPLVAGAVVLLRDAFPDLSAAQHHEAILAGATPLAALDCTQNTRCVASGARLHVAGALDWAAQQTPAQGEPQLISTRLDEGSPSDGDGTLEPGEIGLIDMALRNIGGLPLTDARVRLYASGGVLEVVDGDALLGTLEPGEELRLSVRDAPLTVRLDPACAVDQRVPLDLTLEAAEGTWRWVLEAEVLCPQPPPPEPALDVAPDTADVAEEPPPERPSRRCACRVRARSAAPPVGAALLALVALVSLRRRRHAERVCQEDSPHG